MHQRMHHLSELAGLNEDDFQSRDDDLLWTHTQLRRAAVRVAQGLMVKGIQRGSTIVTLIPNRIEWPLLQYAATLCGATFAPLDYGALAGPRASELRNFMSRLRPDAIFVACEDDVASVDVALDGAKYSDVKIKVLLDGFSRSDGTKWISFDKFTMIGNKDVPVESVLLDCAREPDADRISLICFTSGTSSGRPKGCPRHVGGEAASIVSQAGLFRFEEKSKYLLSSANFRIIAPVVSVAVWSKGGAIVMPGPGFNPKTIMGAFEKYSITHLLFVPTQLHAFVKEETFSPERTGSLKYAIFGGDMIAKGLLYKAKQSLPTAKICAGHGMTEGGAVFEWPYYDTGVDSIPGYGGIVALGTVASGVALRIFHVEDDRIAKRGESAEFQISSPTTIKNYLDHVDQDVFIEDDGRKWFKTGDVGFINKDGVVFLLGRIGDRIKRGGIRITPAALETSIHELIGSQVSVFGIPHEELGQEPYVVVESFQDRTEGHIKQHVVDVFGEVSSIAGACSLQQLGMERFPLNATGKIMKITLRDTVIKYLGR